MAGLYQDGLAGLETLIRELAAFLPNISELPPAQFDTEFIARVRQIEALSRHYPERRELLKKMCFDLCAYALDQSALLWRIRNKPSGYGGDYEMLEMLYTGETHSQDSGRAWDAFIFRRKMAQTVLQRQQFFADAFQATCETRRQVSVLSIAASARDFLRVFQLVPDCVRKSFFYCLEPEAKAVTHYKKLLALVSDVTFVWDSRDIEVLTLERKFNLIWLPRSLPYLSDEQVMMVVRKLWGLLEAKGRLLMTTSEAGDDYLMLEWCARWTLYGRSSEKMNALLLQAGIPETAIHHDGVGWWLEADS